MPWRQAREQSRSNNQNGVTFGKLRSLVITSNHSGLDSYLQELPATLEPRALETKLGALWPQAKVHGLNKWSEAYTTPAPKQGGGSQAEDLCAQPSALHQTESQTQLEPARGKRRSRRKRLPAYSRDLVQLSLDVAQAKHTSQNEQASQRIIAQETARYCLPAMPTLTQPLSCYNASLISSRCPPHLTIRCVHDNSFAIDTLRYDRPPGVHLCAAIGKCSLDHCHARSAHDCCKPRRTHACIYPNQPDRASADGTMPKPSEDQRPQDGALPKPPRSRFRADGRCRRTSGELKKRAPYVQYWKDIQAKQREREEEQASSQRDRPQHFRIHTDESQEAEHHQQT